MLRYGVMKQKLKALFKLASPAILLVFRTYYFIFRPKGESVKCVIRNGGNVLLIRNSYGAKFWTLPGGGVKSSETLEQAAVREAHEEVGIEIREQDLTKHGKVRYFLDFRRSTVWVFSVTVPSPAFHLHGVEIEEAKWFPENAIPGMRSHLLERFLDLAK